MSIQYPQQPLSFVVEPQYPEPIGNQPLDVVANMRYQEILREELGFTKIPKGVLLDWVKDIMSQFFPFQMFIIGGAAQKVLFDYPKNDIDIAIYAQPGNFDLFLHHFLPCLKSLGLQTSDPKGLGFIRINTNYQIISFFDVDIKFPSLTDRTHLFDDDALVVDITNPLLRMTVVPGCIFGHTEESLQHAVECNRKKKLQLSDPSGAKNFSLRTILKSTQGWIASPELLGNALKNLQQESFETFKRNLDLFLLGHGQQDRALFLMNLKNLLKRNSLVEQKIAYIDSIFFTDDIALLDYKKEVHSIVISALRSDRDYDEDSFCFNLENQFFFLSDPLEDTLLEILEKETYQPKIVSDIVKNWMVFSGSKHKTTPGTPNGKPYRREKIVKNCLKRIPRETYGEFTTNLFEYFFVKEERDRVEKFKRLSAKGMLSQVLDQGCLSIKEWQIFQSQIGEALEDISLKDLQTLHSILKKSVDFSKVAPLFWQMLMHQPELSLEKICRYMREWGCDDPCEFILEQIGHNSLVDNLIFKEYNSNSFLTEEVQAFWNRAFQKPFVLDFLGLKGLNVQPIEKEAFFKILKEVQNPKVLVYLESMKKDWISKICALPHETFTQEDWNCVLLWLEDFPTTSIDPSLIGFYPNKMRSFCSLTETDLSNSRKELKTFPKELRLCLEKMFSDQIYKDKKTALEFFKGKGTGPFEDSKYYDFLLTHYPKGIEEGYVEYALETQKGFDTRICVNPRYLKYLRKIVTSRRPSLLPIYLERLLQFEDFETQLEKDFFVLALQKRKIPATKIRENLSFLLEIPDWEKLEIDLLSPLFEKQFLLSLPSSTQLELIEKGPILSNEDLFLKKEILETKKVYSLIPKLLLAGANKGLFLPLLDISKNRVYFDSRKDLLDSLCWSEMRQNKKGVTMEILKVLLEDIESLNLDQKWILAEICPNHFSKFNAQEAQAVAILYLNLQSLSLDWDLIARDVLSSPMLELNTIENRDFLIFLASKVRSKKRLYDPIKEQLILSAKDRTGLDFLTNRELIESLAINRDALEPLLSHRAFIGQLSHKDYHEILKKERFSDAFVDSLLQGLLEKESLAIFSKEILTLSILRNRKSHHLLEKFHYFENLSFEEYRKYSQKIDAVLSDAPESIDIYLKLLTEACIKKGVDEEIIEELSAKILSFTTLPTKIEEGKKELLKLSAWPSSVIFLMIQLANRNLDAPLMVKALFFLKGREEFSENFANNLWAFYQLAENGGVDPKEEVSVLACDVFRHYWRENLTEKGAVSFNIVRCLPLLPKNAVEHSFVQLISLLSDFCDAVEISRDIQQDLLEDFQENLRLFCGSCLKEPRIELINPVLDLADELSSRLLFMADERREDSLQLRGFLFKNVSCFKSLSLAAHRDIANLKEDEWILSMRQDLARKTFFIMMEIFNSVVHLQHDPLLINGVFSGEELPVEQTQLNLLYIQTYLLLGRRFFLEKNETNQLYKVFLDTLHDLIDQSIQNQRLDSETFKELLYFRDGIFEHFEELDIESKKGAIRLFTKHLIWGLGCKSSGLEVELQEDYPYLRQMTPTIIDLFDKIEDLWAPLNWIQILKSLQPSDKGIEEFEALYLSKKIGVLSNLEFDDCDFEAKFFAYLESVAPEERVYAFTNLIGRIKQRLSIDSTPNPKSIRTIKALTFFTQEILNQKFLDFLFEKQPNKEKEMEKIYHRLLILLAQRSESFEIIETFCDPQFPLVPLLEKFVSFKFDHSAHQQLLEEIFLPLIGNFKFIFSPRTLGHQSDVLGYLDEKKKCEIVTHWFYKLEYIEKVLLESGSFPRGGSFSRCIQDQKMAVLARCEVKIPEVRAVLMSYFNYVRQILLEQKFLIEKGRTAPTDSSLQLSRSRACILEDILKYVGGCGKKFEIKDFKEVREIKNFFIQKTDLTDRPASN
ncbi:MAG: hypothetical protein FJZ62_00335 [Chlamydiae bacterium]|nr:hypothetical protein [Chlamydiota bacterium]